MRRCEHCIHLYVCVRHFWSEIYSGDNAERDFLKMDKGKWCDLFQKNVPMYPNDCEFCAFQNECDRESEELDAEVLHEKVCATCGMTIEGNYFKVGDNFLQVKYFDDEDTENVFCSKDCLCKSLSVLEIDENGEAFQL